MDIHADTPLTLKPKKPSNKWGFAHLQTRKIETLGLELEEYVHPASGAQYLHLAAPHEENVFTVALRTVPQDSTGVAHILEHTVLCGSQRFPVRDPFFLMLRRSLNTFMNAMTSSDWTAYPFASCNKKDFNNLLQVYLDAVFFARLDPLDFAQEGHRLEYTKNSTDDALLFKGVVFNEMKGAMSSPTAILGEAIEKHIFPTTTYGFNSGGSPECIPELSYEQLQSFYQRHYHPSNAIFITYGDIPAEKHQQCFYEYALKHYTESAEQIVIAPEKHFKKPIVCEDTYPCEDSSDDARHTYLSIAWLLPPSNDIQALLRASLLSSILFEDSSAPMQLALEKTKLGANPSPLCGLHTSGNEMLFVCGLEGSEAQHQKDFENLVINTLEQTAQQGISDTRLEALLYQFELLQREIGGDSYPFGLQLSLRMLPFLIHRRDPHAILALDEPLRTLREEAKHPDFVKQLINELLINNQHRITHTLKPDTHLSQQLREDEEKWLEKIKKSLSTDDAQALITQSELLHERQTAEEDVSILPTVKITDVEVDKVNFVEGQDFSVAGMTGKTYGRQVNGLCYQHIISALPTSVALSPVLVDLFADCLTELGVKDLSYEATQAWQTQVCGSIGSGVKSKTNPYQLDDFRQWIQLAAKGLQRKHKDMSVLLHTTLESIRFDEYAKVQELIAELRAYHKRSLTMNGHRLAAQAAASGLNKETSWNHQSNGLAAMEEIKALAQKIDTDGEAEALTKQLGQYRNLLLSGKRHFLLVGDENYLEQMKQEFTDTWENSSNNLTEQDTSLTLATSPETEQKQIWLCDTQVNFCAIAYPTVNISHLDAAPLAVLGHFLHNGLLHSSIREQGGAYGSGATQNSATGTFRMFSYRDPRLFETFDIFTRADTWLKQENHKSEALEEAVLGVIAMLDKPGSPAGEAINSFYRELNGLDVEQRRTFRHRVLATTLDDLLRVSDTWLAQNTPHIAVVTDHSNADNCTNNELFKNASIHQL